jgi:hypothetical protein
MKLTIFQKIGIALGLLVGLCICFDALFTKTATPKNTKLVRGHFQSLVKGIHRGDVSYDLYLSESDDSYRISADWAHCFREAAFREDVRPGQLVELYLHKEPFRITSIASINSGGTTYLDMDCVNNNISENRTELPLIVLGFSLVLGALFFFKQKNHVRRVEQKQKS